MPIDHTIDHERRLVIARARGVFTAADAFGYQQIWTRPEIAGYDELVDMTDVNEIAIPTPAGPRVRQLATTAAAQDREDAGRFAIVAPGELAFGLGRQFQLHRELDARSRKQVGVFRTMAEALAFLGIESLDRGAPAGSPTAAPAVLSTRD